MLKTANSDILKNADVETNQRKKIPLMLKTKSDLPNINLAKFSTVPKKAYSSTTLHYPNAQMRLFPAE